MPLQLHSTTTPKEQRQLRPGRCGKGQLPPAQHHRISRAQLQLCLSALLPGSLAGRGGASTESRSPRYGWCQVRPQALPGSSGHAPRRRRWSRAVRGSQEQAQSPEPCPHSRPCPTARDLPVPRTLPPQHAALPMSFVMLRCPEVVCLSFPWQSSAGCAQGPHPRPQPQPPPSRADEVG